MRASRWCWTLRCRIYGTVHDKSPAYFKRVIRKKGPDVIILHKPRSALYKDSWPNYKRVVANSTGKQCTSYALSFSVAQFGSFEVWANPRRDKRQVRRAAKAQTGVDRGLWGARRNERNGGGGVEAPPSTWFWTWTKWYNWVHKFCWGLHGIGTELFLDVRSVGDEQDGRKSGKG